MEKIRFFGFILLIATLGCGKSNYTKPEPIENTVLGKWIYTENFYSTGAQGQWHVISPANQTIEFKPDGSFIAADSFLNGVTTFEIVDSTTIKFQPTATFSGFILMKYLIKESERELYLYPVDPICIEGCSYKFKK